MAYSSMKKLIENENKKYNNGAVSDEEYRLWAESTRNKLDVFLASNRLTVSQYSELDGMIFAI